MLACVNAMHSFGSEIGMIKQGGAVALLCQALLTEHKASQVLLYGARRKGAVGGEWQAD